MQKDDEHKKRKLEERKREQKKRRIELEENQLRTSVLPPTSLPIASQSTISSNVEKENTTSEYSILDNEFGTDEELIEVLTSDQFSSTNLAMQKLRDLFSSQLLQIYRFVNNYKFILPPIIMRHMLYAMVENRTEVDRQIDEYLRFNKIRQFHLHTLSRDAIGYVFSDDYVDTVKRIVAKRREERSKKTSPPSDNSTLDPYMLRLHRQKQIAVNKINESDGFEEIEKLIIERFEKNLLPQCRDTYVSREQILSLLACQDKHVNVLVQLGLLTIRDEATFWFSIPNVGLFLDYLVKGREELITALKRKKYKEIMMKTIEMRPMKKSPLGTMFHLRDLLGSGRAECVMTSNGPMISLVNKK